MCGWACDEGVYIPPAAGVRFRKLLLAPDPPSGLSRSALRASCRRGLSLPSLPRDEEYPSLEVVKEQVTPGVKREAGVCECSGVLVRGLLLQVEAAGL